MTEQEAELRDARHLWGRDTHETDDIIRDETDPKASVARGWDASGIPTREKLEALGIAYFA
jgi:aldehyde:ferredoxin oxidoreductase